MIDALFGSIFGGAQQPCAMAYMRSADFQQAIAAQNNLFMAQPKRVLPPGIFWTRTGGKTHRVVIRRSKEVVIDLSGLGNTTVTHA